MTTVTLKVEGMTCGGCVASVTRVLRTVPGVNDVAVTLRPGEARVDFDPARTDAAALKSAVQGAGDDVVD